MTSLSRLAAALSILALCAPLNAGGNRSGGVSGSARAGGPAPVVSPVSANTVPGLNVSLPAGISLPEISVAPGASVPALPGVVLPGSMQAPAQAPRAAASAPQSPQDASAPRVDGRAQSPDAAPEAARAPETAADSRDEQLALHRLADDGGPAADEGGSAPDAKAALDEKFDGAAKRHAPVRGSLAAAGRAFAARILFQSVGPLLPDDVSERVSKASGVPVPEPPSNRDAYGGPLKTEPMTFKQRVAYGAKWGMNLIGISSLLQLIASPLLKLWDWQLSLPSGILEGLGRVELLVNLGPAAIANGLVTRPISFLLFSVPVHSFVEELIYRGLQFGLLFIALASIRPAARWLSAKLANAEDLFGWRTTAQTVLKWAQGISSYAFPLAATWAGTKFAIAHFEAWGADPFSYLTRVVLAYGLAFVAYRSRSLLASGVAHTVFNLVPLALVAISVFLGSSALALLASFGLTIYSIVFLVRNWESESRLAKLVKSRRGALAFVAIVLALSTIIGMGGGRRSDDLVRATNDAQAWSVQQQLPAAPDQLRPPTLPQAPDATFSTPPITKEAAASAAVAKTLVDHSAELADLTAKVKPAIAKVVVRMPMGQAMGSGFIVRKEGLLITNAHVVEWAGVGGTVRIELADGTVAVAKVVAMNEDRDIAFVQLPEKEEGWPVVPIGDAAKVREGHMVLALGHPLGLPFSTSFGVVSGLGGRGSIYVQQLQTDAAVNHGNSGGPLVNMNGEVIAMNTAIAAPTEESGSIGIGFSITSDFLTAALAQFDATGNINSSYLGIIVDVSSPMKLPGVVQVEQVRPGSPAWRAGIRPGDAIVGVNGKAFTPAQGVEDLARAIAQANPGSELKLQVQRRGKSAELTAKLADR